MYSDWFQQRPHQEPTEWTSDSDEATTLHAFLSNLTTAHDAARKLVLPSTKTPTEGLSDKQWRLWNLVFDVAAELPATHADLIALLEAFRAMEDPGDWAIDWSKLGSFGSVWRDASGSFSSRRRILKPPPPTATGLTPNSNRYINFSAFSARLAASAIANVEIIFGFFALRDALEEPPLSTDDTLNTNALAAAQWIFHAGQQIYSTDNSQIDKHWERGLAKESALWRGEVGFSRARWEFWRGRFEELGEGEGNGMTDEEGKAVVKEAARRMREIEEGDVSR